jgi:adenylyltransferase/sulfurtransferase
MQNLSPAEVKTLLDSGKKYRLIDVREQWEYDIVKLNDAELFPMSKFVKMLDLLNKEDYLIFYCHHGTRSASICSFLKSKGFNNIINLKGGINAWSSQVDPSLPKY